MSQLKVSMRRVLPGLAVVLAIVCSGCGSRTKVKNVCFPPGSDYESSLYNANVTMRDIGLDRTEVIVSVYEQRRQPSLKRGYKCIVHDTEVMRCETKWNTLEDLEILLKVGQCNSCGYQDLAPDPKPSRVLELHFMYDEHRDTFTEAPNSDFDPPNGASKK